MRESTGFIICLILITDLCDTVSQLLLKRSINAFDTHIDSVRKVLRLIINLAGVPRVWIALVFSVLSLVMWLVVLSKADLNFAYSVDSMRYILITLASVAILKEKANTLRWIGVIAVVAGIALVAAG